MLQPKRQKFRKMFRGKRRGLSFRGSTLAFGDYGLKATEAQWLTSNQIEAARKAIAHAISKGGKLWIRVFPDKPVSARAAGQRMGGGKGEVDKFVAVITPGRILFEMAGVTKGLAHEALTKAGAKLPFQTKIIAKED